MFGGMGPTQGMFDIECDIMTYCLKKKGKWWANHFFYNREVKELYTSIRSKSVHEVTSIIEDNK